MSASTDPEPTDPELERLLDDYEDRAGNHALMESDSGMTPDYRLASLKCVRAARAALLTHIATRYAQRPPVPALLPTPADVDAGRCRWTEHGWVWTDYLAARGILPWKPGDELPEARIRRLRDGGRQHTLHLDGDGVVAGGAPDFEGDDGD